MIHGQTRIVLKNPISGNILKDVESENTFQSSFIAKYLRNLGSGNASVLTNASVRAAQPWQQFVGGVLLFKETETNSHYMTAGNTMIGNGAFGVINTGNPSEMGSFNSEESSPEAYTTSSAIVQTYDFTTSQAIGQISCVCLTSQTGGYIGYGNARSNVAAATKRYFHEKQDIQAVNPQYRDDDSGITNRKCAIGSNVYGVSYITDGNNHNIRVKRYGASIIQCSVFDGIEELRAAIDVSELHYTYVTQAGFQLAVAGGKIYICPEQASLTAGSTYYYWEYDPSDNTIDEKSFTNPTDKTLIPAYFGITDDLISFMYTTYPNIYLSIFDRSTGTHIGDKLVSSSGSVHGTYPKMANLSDGLALTWLQTQGSMAIYDKENDTLYPINGLEGDFDNRRMPDYYDSAADAMIAGCRYDVMVYNNPLYLATINNLSRTVEKDSSMTMKVIYTLEEA